MRYIREALVVVLEQERHRLGGRPARAGAASADLDDAVLGDVAADDPRDDVEQHGRNGMTRSRSLLDG